MTTAEVNEFLKTWLPHAKDAATLAAAVGAVLYFGYQIAAGWLLINLTPKLTAKRETTPNSDDHLVVTVSLTKGKIDAARLLNIQLKLEELHPEPKEVANIRCSHSDRVAVDDKSLRPDWGKLDTSNPILSLSPEETLEFSEYFRVQSGTVIRASLLVSGDRFRGRALPSRSQWRTSTVILPGNTTPSQPERTIGDVTNAVHLTKFPLNFVHGQITLGRIHHGRKSGGVNRADSNFRLFECWAFSAPGSSFTGE